MTSATMTPENMRAQEREMLFDIYKKEADDLMAEQKYHKALKSFNLAVKLQPQEKRSLVGRSRCYLHMGKTFRAMQDVERSLSIDAFYTDAVYQKAEILFLTGNYQLASVYYKRGQKLDPQSPRFEHGIQRSTEALQKFGGGTVTKNKLSAVGDLSFFLSNKRRHTSLDFDVSGGLPSGREADIPSAGFTSRHHCPLVRISRKPRFPQLTSFQSEDTTLGEAGGLVGPGDEEARAALRQPDEDTMKKILGELYGDRKYLQKLQTSLPGDKAERDLAMLTDEGLVFLRERSVFWDTLGPLPPPVPATRRGLTREQTFGGFSTAEGSVSRELPWKRRQREQAMLTRDITQVDFEFRSHLTTSQRNRDGEGKASEGEEMGTALTMLAQEK